MVSVPFSSEEDRYGSQVMVSLNLQGKSVSVPFSSEEDRYTGVKVIPNEADDKFQFLFPPKRIVTEARLDRKDLTIL